ncbi:tRNA pseudouridine(55) synthase TruB [Ramlibacter sp. MAHUQ-53]|uniref:tRNA pseudouridine(55) synthase TruB n=1 Tax=unclassified Ramlibacter TaxID=2617605 RepID=UPI003637192B
MSLSAPRVRVVRRPVHGVLLIDKPLGLSSNNALQKAKWLLRAEKAGHTGTLDPLATGVLPLCFGAATKFSQLQLEADKTYEAVAVLGVRTTTGDAEGEVLETREVPADALAPQRLAQVRAQFTGPIRQVPPMHSALKKDGKALYEYARAGEEVEREARDVTIHDLRLEPAAPTPGGHPTLKITARVSKGTYIRTLGEDIGLALGCGAHLSALRRIATGHYDVSQCITLADLEAMGEGERLACLQPPESLLAGHTRVTLDAENAGRFLSGMRRRGDWPDAAAVAVFGAAPPALLGTAHVKANELIPGRLLSPIEIQQILSSKEA